MAVKITVGWSGGCNSTYIIAHADECVSVKLAVHDSVHKRVIADVLQSAAESNEALTIHRANGQGHVVAVL